MKNIQDYMNDLPTDAINAVTYSDLCALWDAKPRAVRSILHDLSVYDDGTDFVVIRSNKGGFYKTANKLRIAEYRREVFNRGRNVFACLKKIDRVLREDSKQFSIGNNIRVYRTEKEMTMQELCRLLGDGITPSIVAKMEDGTISPSPSLSQKIADIFGITVEALIYE